MREAILYGDQIARSTVSLLNSGGSASAISLDSIKTGQLADFATITWSGFSGSDTFTIEAALEAAAEVQAVALLNVGLITTAEVTAQLDDGSTVQASDVLDDQPGPRTGFVRNLYLWPSFGPITIVRLIVKPGTASGTMTLGRLFAGRQFTRSFGFSAEYALGARSLDHVARGPAGVAYARSFGRLRGRQFNVMPLAANAFGSDPGALQPGSDVSGELSLLGLMRSVGVTSQVVLVRDNAAHHDDHAIYGFLSFEPLTHIDAEEYDARIAITETG